MNNCDLNRHYHEVCSYWVNRLSSPRAIEDLMFNSRGIPVAAQVFSEAQRTYEKVREATPAGQDGPFTAMRTRNLAEEFIRERSWNRAGEYSPLRGYWQTRCSLLF